MAEPSARGLAIRSGADDRAVRAARTFWRSWNRYGIYFILLFFIVLLAALTPRFATPLNLLNVARQSAVLALLSLGILTVLVTGNVDLTVGSFLGLSGALIAGLTLSLGFAPALLLVALTAVAMGSLNGFLSTRGKGLSVIVTLAMMAVLQGVTLLYTRGEPIIGLPAWLGVLGTGRVGGVPVPVLVTAVVALLLHFVLRHTVFGLRLYATGSNPAATYSLGISTTRCITAAFVISSCLSALAGLLLVARVNSAQPTAGFGAELDAVGAVLIGGASLNGGVGSVIGTLAGVLILGMIGNGLNLLDIDPYYQYVCKGLVILFAILMDQWGRRW